MLKIMVFCFLGFCFFVCNNNYAEPNCIANQFSISERPSLHELKTPDEFYDWRNALYFKEESVAKVPLAKRSPHEGPSVLAGFDIDGRSWQYDFLSTLWSQGGCGYYQKTTEARPANDVYNFKFWQYLDISYYYGHGLLAVPPTMWTNAAHKNGVLSLGTFNVEGIETASVLNDMQLPQTINTLYEIATTLGFDGYLINEEKMDLEFKDNWLKLLQSLQTLGLTMIWYDSFLSGGYANYLNKEAVPFLTSAGFFQTNYWWGYLGGDNMPAKSYQTLQFSHLEALKDHVFQAGDVYRDPYKNDPFQQCVPQTHNLLFSKFEDIFSDPSHSQHYSALGFFAPNWTMFGVFANPEMDTSVPSVEQFEQSDAGFWEGSGLGCEHDNYENVSYFVEPRTTVIKLPFYTNFNTGVGEKFFVDGIMVSQGPWSNFTIQNYLPTWQNITKSPGRTTANAAYDYQDAYDGGNSWKIIDKHASREPVIFRLLKTDFKTKQADEIDLIVKTVHHETLQLIINEEQALSPVKQIRLANGWQQLTFLLLPNLQVKEVDIAIYPDKNQFISVNVGFLKIANPSETIPPENQLAQKNGSMLTWIAKHPNSLYRIYAKSPDGSYLLLNEVANTVYDLHGNIFNQDLNTDPIVAYLIQEVTPSGDFVRV